MSGVDLSGSGGDRAVACPAAFAIEAGTEQRSDDGTAGTAIHAFLEAVQATDRDTALARAPDEVADVCAAIDVAALPKGDAEVAYIWDAETDTARCLGRIEHRKYPKLRPAEIPCTIDLVARVGGEIPLVWEYKTGYDNVPRADASMQLGLEVLAVARTLGVSEVEGAIVRVGGDGHLHVDSKMFDTFALDDVAEEWREALRGVHEARARIAAGHKPDVVPGDHCRYCAAKANCPAFAGVARELLAPGNDWLARVRTTIADDRGAADVWQKLAVAESMLRTVRGIVEERARERPFQLPDGSTVREVVGRREGVESAEKALEALRGLYGDVAESAFKRRLSTTKEAIKTLAESRVGHGEGAAEVRRVLAVLREHKAIVPTETRSVQVVRP